MGVNTYYSQDLGGYNNLCEHHLKAFTIDQSIDIELISESKENCSVCEMTVWRVREIVANIDDIVGQLENYEGDCCGMACSCYDNLLIDIQNYQDELKVLGYVYQNGELRRYGHFHEKF